MSSSKSLDGSTDVGSTNIPGPYLSPEQTESFPLKAYSYKSRRCGCIDEGSGLKVIVVCFFTFTVAVTVALTVQIRYGDHQIIPHGSVATDSQKCSLVGTNILKRGGNAVDAAVASTVCMGVVNPHVTGLGGGGFMVIYNHRKRQILDIIDFREVAPAAMSPENFTVDIPQHGGLAVGVPGFLRGLGLAHQLHGKLSWADVINPSVNLCRVPSAIPASLLSANKTRLKGMDHTFLRDLVEPPGERLFLPDLASALDLVARTGPDVFYNGSLAQEVVDAVSQAQGLMTLEDLQKYQPVQRAALSSTFGNYTVIVPGAPSGGPLLLAILGVLEGFNMTQADANTADTVHRLAETIRLTSTYRAQLGDPDFSLSVANITQQMLDKSELAQLRKEVDQPGAHPWSVPGFPEPVGSHVAAMDRNDLYVSVVSGLNSWFGSKVLTKSKFLLNNAMADFSPVPSMSNESASNEVGPGKRPLSLATPAMLVHTREVCGHRMVLGASDATLVAQIIMDLLVFQGNITSSIEAPRIRAGDKNIYITMEDQHKPKLSDDVLTELERIGYHQQSLPEPYASSNIVEKKRDSLSSHSDSRGGGVASRF